ncbi:MAG TPA: carboxypeptidase-like regulatory domain-containing protein [Methylomirabilota bacterium]|nr:carboxypeptidase-like regulatory domain-containing protein [Methylomirabilota bacterium]
MIFRIFVGALAAWALTLAVPSGAGAATVISGTVKNKAGQPLSGLALLEKGEIHNNVWDRGVRVDANGRFRIEVVAGGQYGLHVYSSGYIYAPQPVRVETGKTLELNVVLVAEPTRANDPVIKRAGFFPWAERQGKVTFVKLDVADPNDDLGPQVLAFNAASGRAHALQPPRRVRNLKDNFPQGVYQLEVDTAGAAVNPRDWLFVVADHQCNTTDVLSFPHEPKPPGVIRP